MQAIDFEGRIGWCSVYRCLFCKKVSVDQPERLLGDMILAEDKALDWLNHWSLQELLAA